MFYKISIIVEKDLDGYYGYCPQLPGCQSQGMENKMLLLS